MRSWAAIVFDHGWTNAGPSWAGLDCLDASKNASMHVLNRGDGPITLPSDEVYNISVREKGREMDMSRTAKITGAVSLDHHTVSSPSPSPSIN